MWCGAPLPRQIEQVQGRGGPILSQPLTVKLPRSDADVRVLSQHFILSSKKIRPERRRLSLTQNALCKPIPIGLVLTIKIKEFIDDKLLEYSMFHYVFVLWATRMHNSDNLPNIFREAGSNGRLDFSLFLITFCDPCN